MGIVYNMKVGQGYIKRSTCHQPISRQRTAKALTRQNIQFLKSLNLRVIARGGK